MNGQKLKFTPIEPSRAPEKLRTLNTAKSIMGRRLVLSARTKPARLATDRLMMPRAAGLSKPSTGPWVMNSTRQKMATDRVRMPARSGLRACGSRDSRTPVRARNSVTTARTTWTRKTHRQFASVRMALPMIGPKPRPMPKMMPLQAKARPRSRLARNWLDRMATWQISISAALRP